MENPVEGRAVPLVPKSACPVQSSRAKGPVSALPLNNTRHRLPQRYRSLFQMPKSETVFRLSLITVKHEPSLAFANLQSSITENNKAIFNIREKYQFRTQGVISFWQQPNCLLLKQSTICANAHKIIKWQQHYTTLYIPVTSTVYIGGRW